jgi:hypothetical protein
MSKSAIAKVVLLNRYSETLKQEGFRLLGIYGSIWLFLVILVILAFLEKREGK